MSSKLSFDTQKNDEVINLIAQRVAEFKKNKDASQVTDEEVNSHVDALSEVFNLKKGDVELIAQDVIIKKDQQNSLKDNVYNGLIKYGKQVIAIIIVTIIVSFLMLGRSVVQPQNQPVSNITAVAPDYSKFVKKAKLSNVINTIMPIKIEVMEYYMDQAAFPKSLDTLGVNKNDLKEIDGVDGLILGKKGEIIVRTDKSIGENVVLKLYPKEIKGFMLQWKCQTNFPGYFRGCDRVKMTKELKLFK